MKERIKELWEKQPLILILLVGGFFRLIAVIFSKGYGMHDDHFLIIEPAQAWVDGYTYDNWLPSGGAQTPDGHSLFYSGINFLILGFLKWIGLTDPQGKMYFVRLLHGLWSLLTVIYGYKIAYRYGGIKVARQAGMILSILWLFPMLDVRNLVEMVCIPPLMIITWLLVDPERRNKVGAYALIGLWCGIAFNMRFQSCFFIAGVGIILLLRQNWKGFIAFAIAGVATVFAVQGIVDICVWKRPFAELGGYIQYNILHATDYINGPWYKFIIVVAGILVPPISLFILFGYLRIWKKYPELFWPTFLFFAFHSWFPNKQERFILPIVPVIIVAGCIGWAEYIAQSGYWQKHTKLLKGCWTFFWVLNLIALPVISITYTKRTYVESMCYLSTKPDLKNYLVEMSNEDNSSLYPIFYLKKWDVHPIYITKTATLAKEYYKNKKNNPLSIYPNYAIFYGTKNMDKRVAAFKKMYPDAQYLTTIYPSFIDRLMTFLNPINKNETDEIYKFSVENANPPSPQDTMSSGK